MPRWWALAGHHHPGERSALHTDAVDVTGHADGRRFGSLSRRSWPRTRASVQGAVTRQMPRRTRDHSRRFSASVAASSDCDEIRQIPVIDEAAVELLGQMRQRHSPCGSPRKHLDVDLHDDRDRHLNLDDALHRFPRGKSGGGRSSLFPDAMPARVGAPQGHPSDRRHPDFGTAPGTRHGGRTSSSAPSRPGRGRSEDPVFG